MTGRFCVSLGHIVRRAKHEVAETSRLAEAITSFDEPIWTLTYTFVRYPAAIAPLMAQVLSDYPPLCEAASVEPDRELLTPVFAVFDQLKSANLDQGATK